jgi:hypothetical protein
MSSDDEELREAERAFRSSGTLEARHAYARLLRRAGHLDDLLEVLLPGGPDPLKQVVALLSERFFDRTLLVATGQYAPVGQDRVGVLDVTNEPELAWDGFVVRERIPAFREALTERNTIWPGELDFMYATPWTLAWTTEPAPLRIWNGEGELLSLDGDTLRVKSSPTSLAAKGVRSVEVWLANGWVTRGVSLHVASSSNPIEVVQQDEPMASFDPTYDGINLMCDAAWAVSLGKTIAKTLGVPCKLDKDLD